MSPSTSSPDRETVQLQYITKTDSGTSHKLYPDFTSFTRTHWSLCLDHSRQFCHMQLCVKPPQQHTEVFIIKRLPWATPLKSLCPIPWQPLICFPS